MNKIVMIIDDDDDDRELFADALKETGHSVQCLSAMGGREGLALLNQGGKLPDLVFLDLNMPCLSGKQCLVEIKKIPRLARIPVIVYSTTKRTEDVEETKKLGAAYFLTKPTLFSEICVAIKAVLNTKWE